MAIWHKPYTLAQLQADHAGRAKDTMLEHLGIELTELGDSHLTGKMPVDHRTHQPLGLLHGRASAALAETLASIAANLVVDTREEYCVGLEINANHLRSCREGFVVGETRPIHIGRTTQVWDIRITHEGKPVCVSRLTLAVLKHKR